MQYLLVFCALLFDIRHVGIQAQSVTWKFPTANNQLSANRGDTVLLDYTSTLSNTILRMWCSPEGGNQSLASSFFVDADGPFSYVLAQYAPGETEFPLHCHGQIADDPLGGGTDSPAAIVFSSRAGQVAKTISQSQSVTASIVTTTLVGPTQFITTTGQGTSTKPTSTDTLSQSTTSTTPTLSPTSTSSQSSSISSAAASAASQPSTSSSSSNTGAIVGGVIGGLALLSFIVLALLFLRRYRRNHAEISPASTVPTVPTDNKSSKPGFNLLGFYQKRGAKPSTVEVHEKEGSYLPHSHQVHEVPGSTAAFELPASSNNIP